MWKHRTIKLFSPFGPSNVNMVDVRQFSHQKLETLQYPTPSERRNRDSAAAG